MHIHNNVNCYKYMVITTCNNGKTFAIMVKFTANNHVSISCTRYLIECGSITIGFDNHLKLLYLGLSGVLNITLLKDEKKIDINPLRRSHTILNDWRN